MSDQVPTPGVGERAPATGWPEGHLLFAVVTMVVIGIFHVISGIAAILQGHYFAAVTDYVFRFNVAAWGWIHLFLGILVASIGVLIYTRGLWARATGIIVAAVSSIESFMFMPYYPLSSLLIIALDVVVIWVLSVHGQRAPHRAPRAY
ncbi:MAG TPA: hypothetical protein VGP70_00180 [Actinomadura sp.]|jgi:hypothetical protein|nr:hypothetical protein [Actinomadura sp.]